LLLVCASARWAIRGDVGRDLARRSVGADAGRHASAAGGDLVADDRCDAEALLADEQGVSRAEKHASLLVVPGIVVPMVFKSEPGHCPIAR
jgi:hypothetical protein